MEQKRYNGEYEVIYEVRESGEYVLVEVTVTRKHSRDYLQNIVERMTQKEKDALLKEIQDAEQSNQEAHDWEGETIRRIMEDY